MFGISLAHEAGYICSMLFIIPGFPFITSGIDLAKLDMRSGLERLAYAMIIILVATLTAWIMALILHLKPSDFPPLSLTLWQHILFRLLASFCGVFGFSVMFNSPKELSATAGIIGAIANTLRLELVDLASCLLQPQLYRCPDCRNSGFCIKSKISCRISLTVPSIVIMVPGLYLYRAIYNLGVMSLQTSASWFAAVLSFLPCLLDLSLQEF